MYQIAQYAKTIAALVGAVLTSVSAALPEVPLWLTITLAVATAVAVFVFPNAPTDQQREEVVKELVAEDVLDGQGLRGSIL